MTGSGLHDDWELAERRCIWEGAYQISAETAREGVSPTGALEPAHGPRGTARGHDPLRRGGGVLHS